MLQLADDQAILVEDKVDISYILRHVAEVYINWILKIIFHQNRVFIIDGAGQYL